MTPEAAAHIHSQGKKILDNISRVIVGKEKVIELVLAALIGEGHVLLQDVPGVGKTLLAKSLARSIGGMFKRIQFAPDLLPADITGFNIYDQKAGNFVFQHGPVLTHILLADEINRAVPRTQASLLESMEERHITIDGTTMALPRPFFVLATENPIELEGTFPLPEAQLDRFVMQIRLGYPDRDEEMAILERFQGDVSCDTLEPVLTTEDILTLQEERRAVIVSSSVRAYITDIVRATRVDDVLELGASPRASLSLMRVSQARAALQGRTFVLPDDVKHLAPSVLRHRLILTTKESLRGTTTDEIVASILDTIPVPDSND